MEDLQKELASAINKGNIWLWQNYVRNVRVKTLDLLALS